MVMTWDRAEQEALKVDIDDATIKLETVMDAMLNDRNKSDDSQLTILQDTWAKFKKTRETKIVPAVYAGDNEKAIGIATGVQAKRMAIMNGAVQALNGDNCNY